MAIACRENLGVHRVSREKIVPGVRLNARLKITSSLNDLPDSLTMSE